MAKGKGKGMRRGKGRRRGFRKAPSVPEYASLTESVALTNITGVSYQMNGPGGGQVYGLNGTQLSQFISRATAVAQAYQHYRIKRILLEFKPQVDTFLPDVGVLAQVS